MAAGLSSKQKAFNVFQMSCETVERELLTHADLLATIETDDGLQGNGVSLATVQLLSKQVLGQDFNQPMFFDNFAVINPYVVGEKHLKLLLQMDQKRLDAIYFNPYDDLLNTIEAVYALESNEFKGLQTVQLQIKHIALIDNSVSR